jgi:hypothetical protein
MGNVLASNISNMIAQSLAPMGLAGGLISGFAGFGLSWLANKIFGKKKQPTKAEAIPVQIVNWSDLQFSLLNVTKQGLLGMTTSRIDRLSSLRVNQALVGI